MRRILKKKSPSDLSRAITLNLEFVLGEMKEMSESDMRRFAELAQDFFDEKLQESGAAVIKKAWASNEKEGLLIVVSCFGSHSKDIAQKLGIPWNAPV